MSGGSDLRMLSQGSAIDSNKLAHGGCTQRDTVKLKIIMILILQIVAVKQAERKIVVDWKHKHVIFLSHA